MSNQIIPVNCPFCGEAFPPSGDLDFHCNGSGPPPSYSLLCESCGAHGPLGYGAGRADHASAKDNAVAQWNRREQPATSADSVINEDRSWKLLQRKSNGEIASIISGLTKKEAEFAKARVEGYPATEEEKIKMASFVEKQDKKWKEWLVAMGFPEDTKYEITNGKSYISDDGRPFRGSEFYQFYKISVRIKYHNDVDSAEIFQ